MQDIAEQILIDNKLMLIMLDKYRLTIDELIELTNEYKKENIHNG